MPKFIKHHHHTKTVYIKIPVHHDDHGHEEKVVFEGGHHDFGGHGGHGYGGGHHDFGGHGGGHHDFGGHGGGHFDYGGYHYHSDHHKVQDHKGFEHNKHEPIHDNKYKEHTNMLHHDFHKYQDHGGAGFGHGHHGYTFPKFKNHHDFGSSGSGHDSGSGGYGGSLGGGGTNDLNHLDHTNSGHSHGGTGGGSHDNLNHGYVSSEPEHGYSISGHSKEHHGKIVELHKSKHVDQGDFGSFENDNEHYGSSGESSGGESSGGESSGGDGHYDYNPSASGDHYGGYNNGEFGDHMFTDGQENKGDGVGGYQVHEAVAESHLPVQHVSGVLGKPSYNFGFQTLPSSGHGFVQNFGKDNSKNYIYVMDDGKILRNSYGDVVKNYWFGNNGGKDRNFGKFGLTSGGGGIYYKIGDKIRYH